MFDLTIHDQSNSPIDEASREVRQMGLRIRELRRLRKLTTRQLAAAAGVSASLINQLETGKANPSVTSLRRIATSLGTPLADFFLRADDGDESAVRPSNGVAGRVVVVRKEERKRLHLPKSHLVYELLTPDLRWDLEFLVVQLEPGHAPVESMSHPGHECALLMQGVMHVIVGDEEYVLESGDSITLDSSVPHRIENRGTETVIQISAITPPSL
jgi:transcriptional regulator with XRE-family HTH domain